MLISVIVPCFNCESSIGRAIHSVIDNYPPDQVEVIAVNDCSTDRTTEVLRRLSKYPSVHVIENTQNLGVSASRNRALQLTTGEWVALLDADDELPVSVLTSLVEYGVNKGADLVAGNSVIRNIGSKHEYTLLPNRKETDVYDITITAERFILENWPGHPCLRLGLLQPLFRKQFLLDKRISYNENLRFNEDFEFVATCLLHGARFMITDMKAYFYNRGNGLTSRSKITKSNYKYDANDNLMALARSKNKTLLPTLRKRRNQIIITQSKELIRETKKMGIHYAASYVRNGRKFIFLLCIGVGIKSINIIRKTHKKINFLLYLSLDFLNSKLYKY